MVCLQAVDFFDSVLANQRKRRNLETIARKRGIESCNDAVLSHLKHKIVENKLKFTS